MAREPAHDAREPVVQVDDPVGLVPRLLPLPLAEVDRAVREVEVVDPRAAELAAPGPRQRAEGEHRADEAGGGGAAGVIQELLDLPGGEVQALPEPRLLLVPQPPAADPPLDLLHGAERLAGPVLPQVEVLQLPRAGDPRVPEPRGPRPRRTAVSSAPCGSCRPRSAAPPGLARRCARRASWASARVIKPTGASSPRIRTRWLRVDPLGQQRARLPCGRAAGRVGVELEEPPRKPQGAGRVVRGRLDPGAGRRGHRAPREDEGPRLGVGRHRRPAPPEPHDRLVDAGDAGVGEEARSRVS